MKKHKPVRASLASASVGQGQPVAETELTVILQESLEANQQLQENLPPHLIIEARAGTGKTTTLIEGLKRIRGIPSALVPSPQQAAIWEAMDQGPKPGTICFVAFNKAIAEELQRRVPAGCGAMTMHSMGFKAINKTFNCPKVNSFRVQDIISGLLETDIRELRGTKPEVIRASEELVGLCKMNLIDPSSESLSSLAAYYDIDLNGSQTEVEVFSLVPRVLERCKDVARDNCIDFNDMIWVPVVLNLSLTRYDLLLVDEAQDLNRCQQTLAKRAGKRLILCGDPKQAIYGFAGADAESMTRLYRELQPPGKFDSCNHAAGTVERGCVILPLTVTRRCGKAIVAEAKSIVPDFEAFETNLAGLVSSAKYDDGREQSDNGTYRSLVQGGDMILCRVNAPLVSQCFRFLKAGRKANIQGRDIGKGLITTINKMKSISVADLLSKLSDWSRSEQAKEQAKGNPNEARIIAIQDRYDCLCCFCEDQATVQGVVSRIEAIFTDDKTSAGIRLSSIHKAKGLEARRVFFLQPKGAECPHSTAKTAWAREQEMNLCYVAITRAIEELVYVS